jgi:hypothetical protein
MFKIVIFWTLLISLSECGYWEDPTDYDGPPVVAGVDENERVYYVIQGEYKGSWVPGKWSKDVGAYVSDDGKEHKVENFKVKIFHY